VQCDSRPVDLPFDHRSAPWTPMGGVEPRRGSGL
jgi:hypothetical protein